MDALLVDHASLRASLKHVTVAEMKDGGMGSLRFGPHGDRKLGRTLVEASAVDADEVPILLSVNLDEQNDLLELDIWKVDFSPVQRLPAPSRVAIKRMAA